MRSARLVETKPSVTRPPFLIRRAPPGAARPRRAARRSARRGCRAPRTISAMLLHTPSPAPRRAAVPGSAAEARVVRVGLDRLAEHLHRPERAVGDLLRHPELLGEWMLERLAQVEHRTRRHARRVGALGPLGLVPPASCCSMSLRSFAAGSPSWPRLWRTEGPLRCPRVRAPRRNLRHMGSLPTASVMGPSLAASVPWGNMMGWSLPSWSATTPEAQVLLGLVRHHRRASTP